MKLLIVGSDKVYAIENFYVKYLRELGVEILHFPAQSIFYDYYQAGIVHKLLFKAGLSNILEEVNRQLKNKVIAFSPDVVWVFKGMEIFPATLLWIKEQHIKLVNFNGDNPFLFSGKGSGNKNVTDSIGLFDLHLTYNSEVKARMESAYSIATEMLPFGFDITEALYQQCTGRAELVKACFLGNPDEARGKFIQQLAEAGIELDVYGNHWEKFVQHPNITVFKPVYGDVYWYTLRKYRVQLNIMRPHNPGTHNMRSFELPGVGGIQLAPATADHRDYFEAGREIFLYGNIEECIQQIRQLLAISPGQANLIRRDSHNRCIASGYRYQDRAVQALGYIKKILE